MRERLARLDRRWVPRAARALRRVLGAGAALDARTGRRGPAARAALAPPVVAGLVALVVLAGGASALEELGDRQGAGGAPLAPVALGPGPATSLDEWVAVVRTELETRAADAPGEPTLALVAPRQRWTPDQAAGALAGLGELRPFTAAVRLPSGEEREVGVRVLPGDLAEAVGAECACTVALLVQAPLAQLQELASRPDVLAVQPARRGAVEPSAVELRPPDVP